MSFTALIVGSDFQKGQRRITNDVKKVESKPELFEQLLPIFSPGYRRLTPGSGYLEAQGEPNIRLLLYFLTLTSFSRRSSLLRYVLLAFHLNIFLTAVPTLVQER